MIKEMCKSSLRLLLLTTLNQSATDLFQEEGAKDKTCVDNDVFSRAVTGNLVSGCLLPNDHQMRSWKQKITSFACLSDSASYEGVSN